jgi:hypothetical protein
MVWGNTMRLLWTFLALPLSGVAQDLGRSGNLVDHDASPVPSWMLVLAGIGLIVYGLKNLGRTGDANLSLGLGLILLVGGLIL